MKTQFAIHVILFKNTLNAEGEVEKSELLEEEELKNRVMGFEDEGEARRVFSEVTGVDVNLTKPASRDLLVNELVAYKEGVLTDKIANKHQIGGVRPFTDKDAVQIQMAIGLKGFHASAGQIIHVAQELDLI